LPGAASGNDATKWRGILPASGDYVISVGGVATQLTACLLASETGSSDASVSDYVTVEFSNIRHRISGSMYWKIEELLGLQ